jgi:ketosteroid isomerase-like protein
MSESPITVAQAFVRAINRQSVEAIADLMTEDHRFIDSLGNRVEGREKMRAGWSGYFRIVPDYIIAIEETHCDGSVVVVFGMARGTYSPDGSINEENRWQAPAAFRAFIEGNKVAEWRVYCDNEPIRQKMAKRG